MTKDTMLAELRARVARIEGGDARFAITAAGPDPGRGGDAGGTNRTADAGCSALALGVAEIDRRLPGRGLQTGRLHEVVGSLDGAGTGFVVHLLRRLMDRSRGTDASGFGDAGGPVLWCAPQTTLYAPGLACRGLDVDRLVCVVAPRRVDRLWAMEEALRCQGVAAVVGELRDRETVDLTASRRLQLAADQGGALALLLRPPPSRAAHGGGGSGCRASSPGPQRGRMEAAGRGRGDAALSEADELDTLPVLGASAAVTRWHVRPLPLAEDGMDAAGDDDMGRRARWRLTLLRSRAGARHAWTVEVNHATGDLALAAPLRDRPGAAADRAVA